MEAKRQTEGERWTSPPRAVLGPLGVLATCVAMLAAGCGQRNWLSLRDVRALRDSDHRVAVSGQIGCRSGGVGSSCAAPAMGDRLCVKASWRWPAGSAPPGSGQDAVASGGPDAASAGSQPVATGTIDSVASCGHNLLPDEGGSQPFALQSNLPVPNGQGIEILLGFEAPDARDLWQLEDPLLPFPSP
jgi:hypothetical protein